MLKDVEQLGVTDESDSTWSSPVVLVRKKNGHLRFCVDYRYLNDVTKKKNCFQLPRIDDSLDTLSGDKYFSTLDLSSGFWKAVLHPDDKEKTAFSTGRELWQFTVTHFGFCNAPATLEHLIQPVLLVQTYEACLVHLDCVTVVGRTLQESLKTCGRRCRGSEEPVSNTTHKIDSYSGRSCVIWDISYH